MPEAPKASCPDGSPEPLTVELGISRVDLAALLGTVPETLSRTFRALQEDGVISARGRTVSLLDIQALATRAQGNS